MAGICSTLMEKGKSAPVCSSSIRKLFVSRMLNTASRSRASGSSGGGTSVALPSQPVSSPVVMRIKISQCRTRNPFTNRIQRVQYTHNPTTLPIGFRLRVCWLSGQVAMLKLRWKQKSTEPITLYLGTFLEKCYWFMRHGLPGAFLVPISHQGAARCDSCQWMPVFLM